MIAVLHLPGNGKAEIDIGDDLPEEIRVPTSGGYGLKNPPPLDENGVPEFPVLKLQLIGVIDGKAWYV